MSKITTGRRVLAGAGAFLALLTGSGAAAHEMFLKPQDYRIDVGEKAVFDLVNGTFERSENAISRDRMIDVTILGGGAILHPRERQWNDRGDTSVLTAKLGEQGTYAVGVSTKPRVITLSAEEFTEYLRSDGVTDTLDAFRERSDLTEVRERYSKHVRTIVQVGGKATTEHKQLLGYPVEIILDDNPYRTAVGDEVGFRVYRDGEPLGDQLVYVSYEGYDDGTSEGHRRAFSRRTDASGGATFEVTVPGVWYITVIHMERLEDDPEADYESNWATVTFKITE